MKNKLSCLIVITLSLMSQQSYASCGFAQTANQAYKSADLVANIFVLRNQIPNNPNTVEAVVHEAWKSPAELKNKATFQIAGVSVENPQLEPGRSYILFLNKNKDGAFALNSCSPVIEALPVYQIVRELDGIRTPIINKDASLKSPYVRGNVIEFNNQRSRWCLTYQSQDKKNLRSCLGE